MKNKICFGCVETLIITPVSSSGCSVCSIIKSNDGEFEINSNYKKARYLDIAKGLIMKKKHSSGCNIGYGKATKTFIHDKLCFGCRNTNRPAGANPGPDPFSEICLKCEPAVLVGFGKTRNYYQRKVDKYCEGCIHNLKPDYFLPCKDCSVIRTQDRGSFRTHYTYKYNPDIQLNPDIFNRFKEDLKISSASEGYMKEISNYKWKEGKVNKMEPKFVKQLCNEISIVGTAIGDLEMKSSFFDDITEARLYEKRETLKTLGRLLESYLKDES